MTEKNLSRCNFDELVGKQQTNIFLGWPNICLTQLETILCKASLLHQYHLDREISTESLAVHWMTRPGSYPSFNFTAGNHFFFKSPHLIVNFHRNTGAVWHLLDYCKKKKYSTSYNLKSHTDKSLPLHCTKSLHTTCINLPKAWQIYKKYYQDSNRNILNWTLYL